MFLQQAPPESFVVTVVQTPAREVTIVDVVMGSLGIVGVLALAAVLLGGAMSLVMVLWNRRHRPEDDHMPSVATLAAGPNGPPSSPAR